MKFSTKVLKKHLETIYPYGEWNIDSYTGGYSEFEKTYWFENKQLAFRFYLRKRKQNDIFEHDQWVSKKMNGFADVIAQFFESENKDVLMMEFKQEKYIYRSTGKNSALAKSIFEYFPKLTMGWKGDIIVNDRRLNYSLELSYKSKSSVLELRKFSGKTDYGTILISNQKDIDKMVGEINEFKKEVLEKEKEFLPIVQKYDKTAYYKEDTQTYYIFGNPYRMFIKKCQNTRGQISYKGRVEGKYISNKDLNYVVDEMKKKVENFIKKNRVNATIQGKTFQFIDRFLHHITGKKISVYRFKDQFDTSFTEQDLNLYLKDRIDSVKKVEFSSDKVKEFQEIFRKNGKKNRIKKAYKYDDLYVFISGTKYHLFKETDLKKIS